MYIKKLRVYNYKSYFNSGEMEFTPGINIIVGRNNAGKTSLLEVLTLDFKNEPHRSLKTLPNQGSIIQDKKSRIEIILYISTQEIQKFIKSVPNNIGIPQPKLDENYLDMIEADAEHDLDDEEYGIKYSQFLSHSLDNALSEFKAFLDNSDFQEINLCVNKNLSLDEENLKKLLNFETYDDDFNGEFYKIKYEDNKISSQIVYVYTDYDYYDEPDFIKYKETIDKSIGKKLFDIFISRIYRFKAERLNIGICKLENNAELKLDASNLAEVLCILQGKNRGMFDYFNELVSSIMLDISSISVIIRENSDVEILVWNSDSINHRRDDLSIPLSSCGSGVGQVLAIVYILVSSIHETRTLIIDEPQSFLHPGAAKKLIETIKQFPQHQYFIATHSPDIITTSDPSNIIKLKYENCETTASVIDAKDIKSQNQILDELGIRLSDVFGADSVLWVEGPTEEKCFPLIIDKFLASMPLKGMKILRVDSVSALLDGKHASLVARIYNKLTSEISLIPEKSIFIFDKENKKETQIEDLKRIGFKFLERPMYENYILNPDAISAIINEEAQETSVENADHQSLKSPITSSQVQQCFEKIQQDEQYLLKGIENDNWLFKFHGANVIQSVFQALCENQLDFNGNKPKYCRKITEWLIKNQPDFLSELAEELKECLNKDKP